MLEVQRDRGVKMYRLAGDSIQNVYTLSIDNMDRKPHTYDIHVAGDFAFEVQGYKAPPLDVGEILNVPIRIAVKSSELKGEKNNIVITLTARDNPAIKVSRSTIFIGPAR